MCLNKLDSEYALGPKYAEILNMERFPISTVAQRSESARICLDRVLNISCVLNMPGFSIWLDFEYARVTYDSKYAKI